MDNTSFFCLLLLFNILPLILALLDSVRVDHCPPLFAVCGSNFVARVAAVPRKLFGTVAAAALNFFLFLPSERKKRT